MKNRFTAYLTAGILLAAPSALLPASAAEDPVFGTLPDWVPQDFAEALQFSNTHGQSYVSDGIICLVRPMLQWKEADYSFEISGTMTEVDTPASVKPKIYELEIPEKPDLEDKAAVAAYEAYCAKLGLSSTDYSFFEGYAGRKTQYAFEVELFRVVEGTDVTVTWYEKQDGENKETGRFSFMDKAGEIVETDLYGWLPDCLPEYKAFLEKYGRASVHGAYIAYCSDVNESTGAILKLTQEGTTEFKECLRSDCGRFELVPKDGGGSHEVILYAANADGNVDITWTVGRSWEGGPEEETKGSYTVQKECTEILDFSGTVIRFLDKGTGELIDPAELKDGIWMAQIQQSLYEMPQELSRLHVTSNPFLYDKRRLSGTDKLWYDEFSVSAEGKGGRYILPEFEVTEIESGRYAVNYLLTWYPDGDADVSGTFDGADTAALQNWLLGDSEAALSAWKSVDFCRDGQLNARDLTLMQREQKKAQATECVLPEVEGHFPAGLQTTEDVELRLGPDDRYPVIGVIPAGAQLSEIGYMDYADIWMYTMYEGQYGWIRTQREDSSVSTVMFFAIGGKPVIYLYPEEETDVHVSLSLENFTLSTTYPKYRDGWDVTAYPDGTLVNKADGSRHRYLFWEAVDCRLHFDFSKGFCVAGSDTERFLKEKLTYMGLTEDEMNEFIVYWLPLMEHNPYNVISFQDEIYTDAAKLDISPAPDSLLRIFMTYAPLSEPVEIAPQELKQFERKGFAAVEWGGTPISQTPLN